jgi:hypothetical protein
MRKRYLWTDRRGADLQWLPLGNVNLGATGKGSLVYWVRKPAGDNFWKPDLTWAVVCDSQNMLRSNMGRAAAVYSGGTLYGWGIDQINWAAAGDWELHCHLWDFSAGTLESYYDAAPSCAVKTGVPAPVGTAQHIQLGYPYSDPTVFYNSELNWHGLAIWDDLLTVPQMQAILARGHLDELQASDGTGNLTFLLRLNETLTADVAGGAPTSTVGTTTPASRWCFVNEGLLNLGTAVYPLGLPRHDGSDDDRLPLGAVCPLTLDEATEQAAIADTHETNYVSLAVSDYTDIFEAGAYFPPVPLPGTYRQLIHVPDAGNTPGYELGIGPLMYKHYPSSCYGVFDQFGSGRSFAVQAADGNTTTSFLTDLTTSQPVPSWVGAWVRFFSGACQGYGGKVVSFDTTSLIMALDTPLPAVPAAGDAGFINFYPRILGQQPDGTILYPYTMEANLWAHQGDSPHFVTLEYLSAYDGGFVRYERGRTAPIPGAGYNATGRNAMYGKGYGYSDSPPTQLDLWLQKIEIGGPQTYQILGKQTQRQGVTLADNFMVRTRDPQGTAGDSVKLWRQSAVTLVRNWPVKQTDYHAVTADLQAPGTWRHTVDCGPVPVAYDETAQVITCAITGMDTAGVRRLGYLQGQADATTGRLLWTDEPAPAGAAHPVLDLSTLRTDRESDAPVEEPPQLCTVLPAPDGTWSLLYYARPDEVDGGTVYCLHGAPDRWSFDFSTQFSGPLTPMFGGVDMRDPVTGNGIVPWVNQHCPWTVWVNPDAPAQQRYLAYVGGKTIYNYGSEYSTDLRPIVGCQGSDLRSLRPLPHGNALTPAVGGNISNYAGLMLGQADSIGIAYSDGNTTGVGLLTSEDGLHFQPLFGNTGTTEPLLRYSELPGESFNIVPGPSFRLGDLRVYYYNWYPYQNYATIRYNGETCYQLAADETAGWLETPILEQPEGGWGELYLNAAPGGGAIRVELRDPATETPLTGWTAAHCSAVTDNVQGRVTWNHAGLGEQTAPYLRLRFYLTAPNTTVTSPALYAWQIAPLLTQPPAVGSLQVEGLPAPAGLGDPRPLLSWTYTDPQGQAQAAWQVQVASTPALLDAGTPDMWDTGVQTGAQTSAPYAGAALADYATYFWRVRARNAAGLWSESW